jgi:excisionase family DNA binding protein
MTNNVMTLPIPNPEQWTGVTGAAELTGINRSTVYAMISDGRLRSYRIAGRRLLWVPEVQIVADALRITRAVCS